ncbi:hypothetical protein ANO11243_035890 [Dothideomycetidae sp. 11243]|nr:hypothetical protein ANO11243_035890 [fungal sp. No.11243]
MKFQAFIAATAALVGTAVALPTNRDGTSTALAPELSKRAPPVLGNPVSYDDETKANKAYWAYTAVTGPVSDDQLWAYAKGYYEKLKGLEGHDRAAKTSSEMILVSVIHRPGHGVFMGTKPTTTAKHKETFADNIKNDAESSAPKVKDVVDTRDKNSEKKQDGKDGLSRIHSEDFTFMQATKQLGSGFENDEHTKGAVYGTLSRNPAGPQNNCGKRGNTATVDPSCSLADHHFYHINYLDKSTFPKNL